MMVPNSGKKFPIVKGDVPVLCRSTNYERADENVPLPTLKAR
jgi:hypothetical protein